MEEPSPSNTGRGAEHQRAYKACIPCRKRKAKCDLGGKDGPPCVRCRRELRECTFSAERSSNKKRKVKDTINASSPSSSAQGVRLGSPLHVLQDHATRRSAQSRSAVQAIGNLSGDVNASDYMETQDNSLQDAVPGLAHSVMRTVVSNGNDALNILFQAASEDQDVSGIEPARHASFDLQNGTTTTTPYSVFPGSSRVVPAPAPLDTVGVHRLWRSCRFVKMGWLSAEDAVTYIDLFFKNMSPLSPVLTDYYADHANHRQLLTEEPLLCCTLLMISSRHHILPGNGGSSRGYFVHDRLWKHCEHLIMRLILGQEKGQASKLRTLGSIEAMLLISEWHPRSLHFPPEIDGWDSSLTSALTYDTESPDETSEGPPNRWLEDVIEPAKRSDRMSWMLLGCGISLAHELNVFGDARQNTETIKDDQLTTLRKSRAKKLLYVFINQLASRLGTTSLLPHSLASTIDRHARNRSNAGSSWDVFMSAWTELTKLLKSLSDMAFPSEVVTQQLLQSGRYVGLLEHFQPLLEQWRERYLESKVLPESYADVLFIEYQYVRIVCNSVGMQAVCERAVAEQGANISTLDGSGMPYDAADEGYFEEVISGSCDMLEKVITLAGKDALKFAPVRVFLRVTTSSVFLLKAMSIGIRNGQLRSALHVLHRSVHALRSSVLDDMHLANRYAVLLELHIKRLQKSILASSKKVQPSRLGTVPLSLNFGEPENIRNDTFTAPAASNDLTTDNLEQPIWESFGLNQDGTTTEDDWLSLPFDPAMAPFGPSGVSVFPVGLDNDGLNFIWNLPA